MKTTILDLFNQKEVLDYLKTREYPKMLGAELFPEEKRDSLEFDMLVSGSRTPVIASVHGFDTEAEIGEREAQKMSIELALIKRKLQLKEKEIIAIENPRTDSERAYLMKEVYNDFDSLVRGCDARVELMRMQVISKGKIILDENNLTAVIDYGVPDAHRAVNVDWNSSTSNPVADILAWYNKMETKPTRVLTSNTIAMKIASNVNVINAIFGKDSQRIASMGEINAYLAQLGLPTITTYDDVYRKPKGNNKYEAKRYFPEDAFVMLPPNELGSTIYGPTAEEIRLTRDPSVDSRMVGNIFAAMYEEGKDPVSTWIKAVTTALPAFPYADEVFQAEIKLV